MSRNVFLQEQADSGSPFQLAVIAKVYDDGVTLYLDGETEATRKHSQLLKPVSAAEGDRVLCAKIGQTSYVVLGALGTPSSPFHCGGKISFFGNPPVKRAADIFHVSNSYEDSLKLSDLTESYNNLIEALGCEGYGLIE